MKWLLKKIIGTKNDRDLKRLQPLVARICELDQQYQSLSEEQLQAKTAEFRQRLAGGETVEDLLCEAFAAVKNACRRLLDQPIKVGESERPWDMVPFDVQLVGAIVLHRGIIAEMATGEGKTLVATMPVYLNALTGQGVHVVTTNDYLARRDAQWMGAVYRYLGLTVGCIQNMMRPAERREQYACDITYGTSSEFGFDYLRDNMALTTDERVQRGWHYAIVDEIDSILIDEARTPLIISGAAPHETKQYKELQPAVQRLVRRQQELCSKLVVEARKLLDDGEEEEAQLRLYQVSQGMPKNKQFMHLMEDAHVRRLFEKIDNAVLTDMRKEEGRALRQELFFTIDEKGNDADLTEKGCEAMDPNNPDAYMLPDLVTALSELDGNEELSDQQRYERKQKLQQEFSDRSEIIHAVDQLIRAHSVYEKDVDYVVQDNQVLIVDKNTGRLMPGRRWSEGLHQAVEAKEGVKVERETQTLATITIQNYFRMYGKLAGMTGTAETDADEFNQIYKLDVVVIPTNRPCRRVDLNDQVYKTQREKFNAIVEDIAACHGRGQPILVGTVSVEKSELLSRMLRRRGIPHTVLNAKNHEREAEIVERAGQPGSVTIATNMAGRGTDIKLGPGVVKLERDVVLSQVALDDRLDGKTLREQLLEDPCGLYVIGTGRHESRRIDRQLRGRCARQGDPGTSRFYISLEDDLMRLFGSDRIARIMERFGIEEGEVLEHPWLNRSIETAQRRVEQQNFAMRKRTLEYDDVMNKQREVIYGFRGEILKQDSPRDTLLHVIEDTIYDEAQAVEGGTDEVLEAFVEWLNTTFPLGARVDQFPVGKEASVDGLTERAMRMVREAYELKVAHEDEQALASMERMIMLQAVDIHWQEYLRAMDDLRQGVGLRAYGQRDPLVEYKREAFTMFGDLMNKIHQDICSRVFRSATSFQAMQGFLQNLRNRPRQAVHADVQVLGGETPSDAGEARPKAPVSTQDRVLQAALDSAAAPVVQRDGPKVGRNDPCPCGSGKKYKKCCGSEG